MNNEALERILTTEGTETQRKNRHIYLQISQIIFFVIPRLDRGIQTIPRGDDEKNTV